MSESNDPNRKTLELGGVYQSLIELAIHGQDNKLNLFSSFLFFQSVLLLAWATVWQTTDNNARYAILVVLTCFGSLSSVLWAVLGSDYADSSDLFSCAAEKLEEFFPNEVKQRPLTERRRQRRGKGTFFTSRRLIGLVTWGFVILYPVLQMVVCWEGFMSLMRCCRVGV